MLGIHYTCDIGSDLSCTVVTNDASSY